MSKIYDFSGFWESKYRYHSHSRDGDFEDTHIVRIYQRLNKLVIESQPDGSGSYLIVNLIVTDNLATGTWEETTSPRGYYKGTTYHGAVQVLISDDGKSMRGKWLGAGQDGEINVGPYELKYIGKDLPKEAIKTAKEVSLSPGS